MESVAKKIINFILSNKIFIWPRNIFKRIVFYAIRKKHCSLVYYDDAERSKIIDFIHKIKQEQKVMLTDDEAYTIFVCAKKSSKILGDIAEVGVYQGGSARIICEVKKNRILHLFDTFEGLPQGTQADSGKLYKGQYSAGLDSVKKYLKKYKNIYFYKGLFPNTASSVENIRFSFVHLDVDLYRSTLDCLNFFYPRMNKGGIILSHDYMTLNGVRKAFDKFFKNKPEPVIPISASQGLIAKI